MEGIAQYARDKMDGKFSEQAEKLVGKSGGMVTLMDKGKEILGVMIRFKDGKAFVASWPR